MRWVFVLIGIAVVAQARAADDPARTKAEATYRDIYGSEHDRAAAGGAVARVAFAKKLLTAAGQVNDDLALKSVILSKAAKLASSVPAGLKTALEIHAALAANPKTKAEHAGEYAVLLEKVLAAEAPANKPKVAADAVAAYREWAQEQARRGDSGAMKSLFRARDLARAYLAGTPNLKMMMQEMEEEARTVEATLQQTKDLARFNETLSTDPKSVEANVGLALLDIKNNQLAKAADRLAAVNLKEISGLGKALAAPSADAQEKAEAAAYAAGVVKSPANKAGLLELARQNYEIAVSAGKLNPKVAAEYLNVLASLLGYEPSAPGKARIADRLVTLAIDIAEDGARVNDWDGGSQALADARAALRRNSPSPAAAAELDAFEKDFRTRLEIGRERERVSQVLKKDPADPRANWSMATLLMRDGKPDQSGPYLAKSDKPDARQLGESLQSTATDLQKAEALRSMANGLNGNDKTAFLTAARDYYERVLQAQPDGPDTLKIKLILGQISDGLPKKEGLPAGVFALFDQSTKDKIYKLYLEKGVGVGTVALDAKTRFSSSHSLRVTPDYRNINVVPNWKLPIVENPQIGQYRYVAFAWKKEGGTKIGIGFRFADGTWQPYSAGADLPNHLSVSKEIPSDWSIVVRDLFRDRGPCEIVGTGLGAYDGVAAFADNVYLGRTEADVRKAASRRRRE